MSTFNAEAFAAEFDQLVSQQPASSPPTQQPDSFDEYAQQLIAQVEQSRLATGGFADAVIQHAHGITDEEVEQYRRFYPDAPAKDDWDVRLRVAERDLYPNGVFKGPRPEGKRSAGKAVADALPFVGEDEQGGARFDPMDPGDLAGGAIRGVVSEFGQNIASVLGTVMRATGNDREAAMYDVVREDIERRAPKTEGIAGAAGSIAGSLAPTGAATLTNSGFKAMMAIYGLAAFGGGTQDYRQTMKERGIEPNVGDEIAHGLGAALTEIVAERLGLEGLLKVAPRIGKAVGTKVLSGKHREAAEVIGELAGASAVNAAEETITQVANNTRARYGFYSADGYDPDRPIGEGVPEAAAGGAFGGVLAGGAGRFGRSRGLGQYGMDQLIQQDQEARIAAEKQRFWSEIEQREQSRAEIQNMASEIDERAQVRDAFTRGVESQTQPEPGGLTPDDVFGRRGDDGPSDGDGGPLDPSDGPTPRMVLDDGTALFDDEQEARGYARAINKRAKPGEQTAEVSRMLGSDTWSVIVPQPAQREPRGESVTDRNRAINRIVNPSQDASYNPQDGLDADAVMADAKTRAMPLAETLDAVLQPLTPIATPIDVSEQEPAEVVAADEPTGVSPESVQTATRIEESAAITGEIVSPESDDRQQSALEPWEMSLDEYRDTMKGKRVERSGYYNRAGQIQANHRQAVTTALQLGRAVPEKAVSAYPELQRERAARVAADARQESRESALETPEAAQAEPVSEQGTVQGASDQDTARSIRDRTEPRRTDLPTREELWQAKYQDLRKMAKNAGIPANQTKRALIDALSDTLDTETQTDGDSQDQRQSVSTRNRGRDAAQQDRQVPRGPREAGRDAEATAGGDRASGVSRSSRAAIERDLIAVTEELADATDQMEIARMEADAEDNYSPVSFSFTGPLPEELSVHLRKRPNLLRWVSTNQPRGEGMDTFYRLGADRMIEILEDFAGSKLTRALRAAEQSDNDAARFLAWAVENMPVKLDGMKFDRVEASELAVGDEVSLHDATFTVQNVDGELMLVEDVETIELDGPSVEEMMADPNYSEWDILDATAGAAEPASYYLAAFDGIGIPINAGSMQKAPAPMQEDPGSMQQRDLLGTPVTEANTGRQQGLYAGKGRGGAQFDLTAGPGESQAARDAEREAIPDDPDQMTLGDDNPTTRWKGDLAEYTGNVSDDGFYELRIIEGHRSGDLVETQVAPDGSDPMAERNAREAAEQRERFNKLNALQRAGQKMIDGAEKRMRDRGARLSANPIPDAADVIIWGAGQIIKGVGTVAQFRKAFRARWGNGYTNDQIRAFMEDSKRYAARHTVEPDRSPPKTIIRATTGQADTSGKVTIAGKRYDFSGMLREYERTTTQRRALREQLKRDERTARKAFRDGVRSIQSTLPDLRRAVRDAQKLKDQAKADTIEGVRKQIRLMVEESLPTSLHGRFIPELTGARTIRDLTKAIGKLRRELARWDARISANGIRNLTRASSMKKLDNETRSELRKLMAEAMPYLETVKAYGRGRRQSGITTAQIAEAAEQLGRIEKEMAEFVAYYEYLRKAYGREMKQTRDELAAAVVGNVAQSKTRTRQDPDNPLSDPSISPTRKIAAGLADARVMSRAVEGVGDGSGVLEYLLVESIADAEHEYLSARRDLTRSLDDAAKRAGYESLSDAASKTTPTAGRVEAERVEVTLGGKKYRISAGQAMALHAMDQQTRSLIAAGVPIQMAVGRSKKPIAATVQEINAISKQLTAQQRRLVADTKALIESTRESTFSAVKQLKGYEPEAVPGYFPRRRNLRQSENAGLPELGRDGTGTRYLENLGFTKEREQGGTSKASPLLIGDLLTVALEHLDNSAKLAHLAVPIRDASGVLLHPEVQRSIASKHGNEAIRNLEGNLAAASRANEGIVTRAGKVVSTLNANVASYYMGLNPGSWSKQLGGIPRMVPILGKRGFREGMAGASSVSMEDLVNGSGYFWERYVGNISGRFSPTAPDESRHMVDMTMRDLSGRAIKNLLAGDLRAAYREARSAGLKPLEILNLFDSINARIAWSAYLNQVEREHPDWDDARKTKWVAIKAAEAVRRTQNSSSPIDQTYWGNSQRGSAAAAIFLFTSDVARARNRIIEAFQESKRSGAEALAAEVVNFGWAQVTNAGMRGGGVAIASLLMGEWDEFWVRVLEAMMPDSRDLLWAGTDVVGYAIPYVAPDAIDALFSGFGASAFNAPAGSVVDDVLTNLGSAGREFIDAFDEGDEFEGSKMLRSLEKASSAALGIFGLNPAGSPYNRIRREMDKIEKERDSRVPSRY
ncbi:MAG: hypothetical protein ABL309_13785 [Phycisphaerales bacterium]